MDFLYSINIIFLTNIYLNVIFLNYRAKIFGEIIGFDLQRTSNIIKKIYLNNQLAS